MINLREKGNKMQIEIQNMIDFAPFPLSIFNSDGKLITANSHWLSIFDIKIKSEYKFDHLDFLKNYGINFDFKKLLKKNETSKSNPVHFDHETVVDAPKTLLNNIISIY